MRSPTAITHLRSRLLPGRDFQALAFIGRGFEVAQYHLHAAVFPGRSPNVVSRFVQRALRRGLIAAERLQRVGMNRLRLTDAGRDLLVASRIARADELFVPRRSVALKDIVHTVWINDLRVALLGLPKQPEIISPAWALQRRLHPHPQVVPDLLAVWNPAPEFSGVLLACEIDLGGESVKGTFAPKLATLAEEVDAWANDCPAAVLVLTSGTRRAQSIKELLPTFSFEDHRIVIEELPNTHGFAAIETLRHLIRKALGSLERQLPSLPEATGEPMS